MLKKCSICGLKKKSVEFHRDRTAKDGLSSGCALCRNLRKKGWKITGLSTPTEAPKNAPQAKSETNLPIVIEGCKTLDDVGQKYGVAVNIVRDRLGHYTLGIHSRPVQFTVHGESEQEVIDLAMSQG